jgi:hypothetical protein
MSLQQICLMYKKSFEICQGKRSRPEKISEAPFGWAPSEAAYRVCHGQPRLSSQKAFPGYVGTALIRHSLVQF